MTLYFYCTCHFWHDRASPSLAVCVLLFWSAIVIMLRLCSTCFDAFMINILLLLYFLFLLLIRSFIHIYVQTQHTQKRQEHNSSKWEQENKASFSYTGWPKKTGTFFVRLHFIKYRPIFELISLSELGEHCNITIPKDSTTFQVCCYTTLWNVSVLKAWAYLEGAAAPAPPLIEEIFALLNIA